MSGYRIEATWTPRREAPETLAARVEGLLAVLGALHPSLAGWHAVGPEPARPSHLTDRASVWSALDASTRRWYSGGRARTVKLPRFTAGAREPAVVELDAVFDLALPEGLAVYAPERVTLTLGPRANPALSTRAVLEGALVAMVQSFEPDAAYAGTRGFPCAPAPTESSGTPPVGWITWLGARYPRPPYALPPPAETFGWGGGTLIVATSEVFKDGHPAHLAAVEAARAALVAHGTLPRET